VTLQASAVAGVSRARSGHPYELRGKQLAGPIPDPLDADVATRVFTATALGMTSPEGNGRVLQSGLVFRPLSQAGRCALRPARTVAYRLPDPRCCRVEIGNAIALRLLLACSESPSGARRYSAPTGGQPVVSVVVSVDSEIRRHLGTRDRGGSRRLPMEIVMSCRHQAATGPAWKACVRESVPRVRISPHPSAPSALSCAAGRTFSIQNGRCCPFPLPVR
jgi:hypothetical protein